MPLHEYRCECGECQEELFLSGADVPESLPCSCGKNAKRVMSSCSCKVWSYDRSQMNPEAEARQCGVDYDG